MRYSLLDAESGNVVGAYDSEHDALRAAVEAAKYMSSGMEDLLLQADTDDGPQYLASGDELFVRARDAEPRTAGVAIRGRLADTRHRAAGMANRYATMKTSKTSKRRRTAR